MLDSLLIVQFATQASRICAALLLFLILHGLGARAGVQDRLLRLAAGFAIWQFVVRWLGELPLLSRTGIVVITLLLAVVSIRREPLPAIPFDWRVALLLLAPLSMALAPAVSLDAMIYHLRFPEMTLHQGWWAYDTANTASYYPAATSTLYLATLAVDAQGVAAQLVHFGFFVATILTIAKIARRLGAPTGTYAALLFAAVPVNGIVAGWPWADLSLLFALATSVLAMLSGSPVLALALLGLAASIKYTALIAGLPIAVMVMAGLARARDPRRMLYGIALAAVVMSPWYVTNLIRTGNPIHPIGSRSGAASEAMMWSAGHASRATAWINSFLSPPTLDNDPGGVLFLIAAVLGLALALRSRTLRPAAGVAIAMWLVFAPIAPAMRLLLPAVAATLLVAGVAFEQLEHRRLAAGLVAAFVIRGGAVVAAHHALFTNPLPSATGVESEDEFLKRNFPPASLFARAATKLPPDARVLAINEVRLFRFPRPVTAARFFDPPAIRPYVAGATSGAEVVRRMRAAGLTHLLIAARPVEHGTAPVLLTRDEERRVTELVRASRVIDREGELVLMELPRAPRPAG